MKTSAEAILAVAVAEIGYKEKKTNASLEDKTANAGSNNYTKYARDFDEKYPKWYNGKKNGYAWCDMFVDWCFLTAFGYETALKLLCQPEKSAGAGCKYSLQYYQNKGQFITKNPLPGDQIFFGTSLSNVQHTGIVEKADSTKVYTIEGNSDDQVARRTYTLGCNTILGYGRPAYDTTSTSAVTTSQKGATMKLVQSILTNNPCYTGGRKLAVVKGLMLHSVGCAQPKASVFINGWNKSTYTRACVHAFIDGNDGTVYQTLPWNHRGWHSGASANNTHIGVEMCEPACIKYVGGSSFTCSDLSTAQAVAKRTYESAVQLFAMLCKEFNLDPLKDGVILSHKEGCARGIASNHGDPEHLWKGLNLSYTMSTFRAAVKSAMSTSTATTNATPTTPVSATATTSDVSNPSPTSVKAKKAAKHKDTSLSGTYTVTAKDGLNMRHGAGVTNTLMTTLKKGVKVKCYGYYDTDTSGVKWLYVQAVVNNTTYTGFCHSGYLSK